MNAIEYYRLVQVESYHWWYKAIHRLVANTILLLVGKTNEEDIHILDAGCGTGGLTEKLCKFGRVTGVDISSLALSLRKQYSFSLVQGSVNELPFHDHVFHVATSISVLYHQLVDDERALKELHRVLKREGYVVLVLPAFRWAFGSHDLAVHTQRRYSLEEIKILVEKAGFRYITGRYIFAFLFPMFLLKRTMERFSQKTLLTSDLFIPPAIVNKFLELLCQIEWYIGRLVHLPFGSSLLVIVQK